MSQNKNSSQDCNCYSIKVCFLNLKLDCARSVTYFEEIVIYAHMNGLQ